MTIELQLLHVDHTVGLEVQGAAFDYSGHPIMVTATTYTDGERVHFVASHLHGGGQAAWALGHWPTQAEVQLIAEELYQQP